MKNNVKYLRRSEQFDLTQEELADALGVSRDTIARLEAGREPGGLLLLRISHFFNKDAREIFFIDNVG